MTKKVYIIFLLIIPALLIAAKEQKSSLQKATIKSTKYFDVNRITSSIRNNGIFARNPITGNSDFRFDEDYIIYTSGLWLAAKVNGEIIASAADFNTDWVGGAIDAQGNPFGKDDSTFRVYKISRGDNASNNPDYADWPIALGAPSDGNGNPLLIGDQTLWCTFTDAFKEERIWYNICDPLGAEIHLTVWGWEDIDNVIFMRWEIINKSQDIWEDAYFGLFSDPDVGDANNDLTGSDSTLNLVYCYDDAAKNYYHNNFAVGYVMLESPTVPSMGDTAITWRGQRFDFCNAPVYAPRIEKHNTEGWGEGIYTNSRTATIIYNRLQCLNFDGKPAIDPVTNKISQWAYSGDPVSGTGWLDDLPRDRRMMLSAGPFDLSPGDTNGITFAIIPIQRNNQSTCVYDLKQQTHAVHSLFRKTAGLFTERVIAIVGQSEVKLPIGLINTAEIKKIEFTIDILSDEIEYVDMTPYGRAQDCSVQIIADTLNRRVRIIMDTANRFLSIGNDTIACVWLNIAPEANCSIAKIKINDIYCTDKSNMTYPLDAVEASIKLEKLPAPPHLIAPASGQYIDGMTLTFSWTKTAGSDPNRYSLDFIDKNLYDKALDDTAITLNIRELVFNDNCPEFIDWTVTIDNYILPIYSPDTFRFQLPSKEKLNFAKSLFSFSLPEETDYRIMWLEDYVVQEPYWYIIICVENKNTDQISSQLYVVEMSDNSAQVINSQQLESRYYYDGLFQIKDDMAFIYSNSVLRTYHINENKQFILQKSITMYYSPHKIIVNKDCLIFYTLSKIIFYRVNSLTELVEIKEFNVSDWPIPDPGSPQHRYDDAVVIKDDYLFFAKGDWGIFDISNPESLKLLCRVDIPDFATTIDYENDRVYVGNSNNWIGIYDVTIKEHPEFIYGERFIEIGSGDAYNKIAMLKVFDAHVYFENWGLVGLQVCHYEPGKYFVLDGISGEYNISVTPSRLYGGRGTMYTIYENTVLAEVRSREIAGLSSYQLYQNHPNPFNYSTQIRYDLNENGNAKISIYNIHGQFVKCLIDKYHEAGSYKITWDGADSSDRQVASGLFFYQLKTDDKIITKKMLLLK